MSKMGILIVSLIAVAGLSTVVLAENRMISLLQSQAEIARPVMASVAMAADLATVGEATVGE